MKGLQEQDISLSEAVGTSSVHREGLPYRRWTPRGRWEEEGMSRRLYSLFCLRVVCMLHWSCHPETNGLVERLITAMGWGGVGWSVG